MEKTYDVLRIDGIAANVENENFESITICHNLDDCFQMRVAQLSDGNWDYGYLINLSGKRYEKLPGEGSGYFRSRDDALIYGLGKFRLQKQRFPDYMIEAAKLYLNKLQNVSLNLFD